MIEKKKDYLTSIACALIITFIGVMMLTLKVQIESPDLNVMVRLIYGDEYLDLDTKRAYGNKVYANLYFQNYNAEGIRIAFIASEGDETSILKIRIALGDFTAKVVTNDKDNVIVHDLDIIQYNGAMKVQVNGIDPYIQINNINNIVRPWIFVNAICIFMIAFVFCQIILFLKKADISLIKVRQYNICDIKTFIATVIVIGIIISTTYFALIGKDWLSVPHISNWEVWFAVVALCIAYIPIRKRTTNIGTIVFFELILAFLIIFSVAGITDFLTADERNSIEDQYFLQAPNIRHWYSDESRMNYTIMGTLWNIVPKILIASGKILYEQMGKLLHWLSGITLILIIADLMERRLFQVKEGNTRAFVFVSIASAELLMPVTLQALANYNYDLFSMLFSILGAIETIVYIKEKENKNMTLAIIFLSCALGEKLTAFPAWLICMVLLVSFSIEKYSDVSKKVLVSFENSIQAVLVTVFVFFICQKYFLDILLKVSPINTFGDALRTLCTMPRFGVVEILTILGISQLNYNQQLVIGGVGLVLGIWLAALIFLIIRYLLKRNVRIKKTVVFVLTMLFLISGIVLGLGGEIDPSVSRVMYAARYVRDYVRAFPTLVLIIVFIALFLYLRNADEYNIYGVSLCFSMVPMVFFYTVVNKYDFVGARYSDMYILFCALIALVIVLRYFIEKKQMRKAIMGEIIAYSLVVLELWGIQPGFTFFYPYWSSYAIAKNEYGINAYWGEGLSIYGPIIANYCEQNGINLDEITIMPSYAGEWLNNELDIQVGEFGWIYDGYEEPTDKEFFVFETQCLTRGLIKDGLPENVDPIIIIRYHGAITARIYNGRDLKNYFEQYR